MVVTLVIGGNFETLLGAVSESESETERERERVIMGLNFDILLRGCNWQEMSGFIN